MSSEKFDCKNHLIISNEASTFIIIFWTICIHFELSLIWGQDLFQKLLFLDCSTTTRIQIFNLVIILSQTVIMSAATLPKSVQASKPCVNPQNRTQICNEFIAKYRNLPNDFLRIPQAYHAITTFQHGTVNNSPLSVVTGQGPTVDMLDISVVEAQLVKNYGFLRMDLYCKIRVGHMVCETSTCPNGAKNPKWNGVYQFSLKPGIDSFHLEIYDEKQFSLDEKIAWLYKPIPPEVFQGITVERWFPLSGRLGHNKEGSVLVVLSHKRVPMRASNLERSMGVLSNEHRNVPVTVYVPSPNMVGDSLASHIDSQTQVPTYVQPTPTGQTTTVSGGFVQAREEDVNQLSEMFPSIDKAVIKTVLENHNNDKEATIVVLLAMG